MWSIPEQKAHQQGGGMAEEGVCMYAAASPAAAALPPRAAALNALSFSSRNSNSQPVEAASLVMSPILAFAASLVCLFPILKCVSGAAAAGVWFF